MHTTLLVTTSVKNAATNLEARQYVVERLGADEDFWVEDEVGNGVGRADYFQVGGGASGVLEEYRRLGRPNDGLGSESDAAVVDRALFKNALAEYEGHTRVDEVELVFWDLDGDPVDEHTYIGKKCVVVVDYHS